MSERLDDEELLPVDLVGLPLDLHRRATEHSDDVTREFQLVALDPSTAPARLIALGEEVERYSRFTSGPGAQLEQALADGRATVDLRYEVPASAADAARRLGEVLDDVDEWCRAGGMLALAASDEVRTYRRWFIGQFVDQLSGAEPVPWPDFAAGDPSSTSPPR
ncbi:MAG TPA: hypothetical protein VF640_07590 [Acidimicrobiales bacterium]|jgi:hypothetical protein